MSRPGVDGLFYGSSVGEGGCFERIDFGYDKRGVGGSEAGASSGIGGVRKEELFAPWDWRAAVWEVHA